MSATTKIEWADKTWGPVRGCSRVNPECDNCYAIKQARRFDYPGGAYEGLTRIGSRGVDWSGVVRLIPSALAEPLSWRKPQRVFVNSMSDLFHESLTFEQIAAVYGVMAAAERHTFMILTKRPKRRLAFHAWLEERIAASRSTFSEDPDGWIARHLVTNRARHFGAPATVQASGEAWPLPNVQEGVSVGRQAIADEYVPLLLQTPAAVRFVSYEPALEAVDFSRIGCDDLIGAHVDQIIVGGESGRNARPFDLAWARSVVEQCKAAGIAAFVKQLGAAPFYEREVGTAKGGAPVMLQLANKKGGDMAEWPEDLRVREFPAVRA